MFKCSYIIYINGSLHVYLIDSFHWWVILFTLPYTCSCFCDQTLELGYRKIVRVRDSMGYCVLESQCFLGPSIQHCCI